MKTFIIEITPVVNGFIVAIDDKTWVCRDFHYGDYGDNVVDIIARVLLPLRPPPPKQDEVPF